MLVPFIIKKEWCQISVTFYLLLLDFAQLKSLDFQLFLVTRDSNFKRISILLPQNPQEFIKKYFIPNLKKTNKQTTPFLNHSVENSTRKCFPPLLIGRLGFLVLFWEQTSLFKIVPSCSTNFIPICICPVASCFSLDEVHASIEVSVTVQQRQQI